MPASIICFITSGDSEAGPMVQTIFVFFEGIFMACRQSNIRFRRRYNPVFSEMARSACPICDW
jgi:hypothetical protein